MAGPIYIISLFIPDFLIERGHGGHLNIRVIEGEQAFTPPPSFSYQHIKEIFAIKQHRRLFNTGSFPVTIDVIFVLPKV